MTDKKLLTPEEVCNVLGIKMSKFRSAIFKNQIPYIKLGRLIRVCEEDLIMWLEQKKNYLLKNEKSKM